jgi:hypothetical protein
VKVSDELHQRCRQEQNQKNTCKKAGKEQKAPGAESLSGWMNPHPKLTSRNPARSPSFGKLNRCAAATGTRVANALGSGVCTSRPTANGWKAHIFKNEDTDKGPAAKRFKTNPDQAKRTLKFAKACKSAAKVKEDEDDANDEGEVQQE